MLRRRRRNKAAAFQVQDSLPGAEKRTGAAEHHARACSVLAGYLAPCQRGELRWVAARGCHAPTKCAAPTKRALRMLCHHAGLVEEMRLCAELSVTSAFDSVRHLLRALTGTPHTAGRDSQGGGPTGAAAATRRLAHSKSAAARLVGAATRLKEALLACSLQRRPLFWGLL